METIGSFKAKTHLSALLDRVAKGEPFSTAFQDRIFISSEEFERRWIDNLNLTLENART